MFRIKETSFSGTLFIDFIIYQLIVKYDLNNMFNNYYKFTYFSFELPTGSNCKTE